MTRKYCHFVLSAFLLFGFHQTLESQNRQKIVITVNGVTSSEKLKHFDIGEGYRKQMRFQEAIQEYRKVLAGGEKCDKESEAHYNVGLCHTWLGDLDSAQTVFNKVIETYPGDGMAFGYAQYGLAWVEVQRKEYDKAVERLQKTWDSRVCPDREQNAEILFQIGRIYGSYQGDFAKAKEIFRQVLEKYPDASITEHPFLSELKK